MSSRNRLNFLRRGRTHDSFLSEESFACHGLPNDQFSEYGAYDSQPQIQSTRRHPNGFYDEYYAAPTPTAHQRFDFYTVPETPSHLLEQESPSYAAPENSGRAQRRQGMLFQNGYLPTSNIDNPPSSMRESGMTELSNDLQRYISPTLRSHRLGYCPEVNDSGSQARRGYGRGAIDYNMSVNNTDMQVGSSQAHRHAPAYQANRLQRIDEWENTSEAQQQEPFGSPNLADYRLSQIYSGDELEETTAGDFQDYHTSTHFGIGRYDPESSFLNFDDADINPYYSIPHSASYEPLQENYDYYSSSFRRNDPTYGSPHGNWSY
ncbi:hypothetical protein CROQUDRAFT_86336 [Cronartium quercuum f. sp. fusiforme G11]|uniref:Uncharacterized protein n=1 Tax=Cronartium quercuum f. sp. fusiforme G11 TaxID=708437 RepID=A0A9P6NWZ1_9BASI|nr:hypothetical protein CROQUDRAFT_86336 [Cronartium quercuum f. sp. fusiforme G11]